MAGEAQAAEMLQIKITLLDVAPPIWRRVLVPPDLSLRRLHDTIQVTMGWYDQHLHEFEVGGRRYGEPADMADEFGPRAAKDSLVKLATLVERGVKCFLYTYDFGDDWRHEVVIERTLPAEPGAEYPRFVDGERRCPPEDCGGPPGFEAFLEAITDESHPEHAELLEWYGEAYDPNDIERETIVVQLSRIARSRRGGLKGRGKPRAKRRERSTS
jgi:hypothetical protein